MRPMQSPSASKSVAAFAVVAEERPAMSAICTVLEIAGSTIGKRMDRQPSNAWVVRRGWTTIF